MEHKLAVEMLRHKDFDTSSRTLWIDAGSGAGVFTVALASLLERGSIIHAIDTNGTALNKIPSSFDNVIIEKSKLNFATDELPVTGADGILMANSLHYILDKTAFIKKIENNLQKDACFLIVEYDSDQANPWVPYPVSFSSLKYIFENSGYHSIKKLHEQSSIYNRAGMYSALINR
jgi:hypothetical protein